MLKKNQNEDSLDSIIDNTFKYIKDIVDANTVVGSVIKVDNNKFVIPVSRISVGMISGGGVVTSKKSSTNAGSGTGFNIEPIGFITYNSNNFTFLQVGNYDIGKSVIDGLFRVYDSIINKEKEGKYEES